MQQGDRKPLVKMLLFHWEAFTGLRLEPAVGQRWQSVYCCLQHSCAYLCKPGAQMTHLAVFGERCFRLKAGAGMKGMLHKHIYLLVSAERRGCCFSSCFLCCCGLKNHVALILAWRFLLTIFISQERWERLNQIAVWENSWNVPR